MTAVEWLENELANNLKSIIINTDYLLMEKLFEQAKEMEKQIIVQAYIADSIPHNPEQGEEYYKMIFEK